MNPVGWPCLLIEMDLGFVNSSISLASHTYALRPVSAGITESVFCRSLDLLDHVNLHGSSFRLEP
jgi:hypothetical protein